MIGIDIVEIARIEKLLERHPKKGLERFLSEEEIALVKSPQSAAGLYAAKEAVAKALGTGIGTRCGFKDIRIHKTPDGAPRFTLPRHLVEAFEITECALSITHDGGFAIAVASIMTSRASMQTLCH